MEIDARIHNRTTLSARCFPMDDRDGREILVVVLKASFDVSPSGRARPLLGTPIRLFDERFSGAASAGAALRPGSASAGHDGGRPPMPPGPAGVATSSLRYPSDLVDEKPGADVILVGTAHPPPDREVTDMTVSLRLETGRRTLYKAVRVFGPRVWYQGVRGVVPGPAARLAPTPLRYEHAYGGSDTAGPQRTLVERRNPAGTGVAADRARLVGTPAPCLEDPNHPLASDDPAPAGFGPIAPDWSPRAERAGTYDDAWRRERAPLSPADFDVRHNTSSDPDLWSEDPLFGDEPVEILGATREGIWRFRLPRQVPVVTAFIRGNLAEARPRVDTYLVDADEGRVELSWRARFPRPKKLDDLTRIRIEVEAPPRPGE